MCGNPRKHSGKRKKDALTLQEQKAELAEVEAQASANTASHGTVLSRRP
jgi:hypothetical protein